MSSERLVSAWNESTALSFQVGGSCASCQMRAATAISCWLGTQRSPAAENYVLSFYSHQSLLARLWDWTRHEIISAQETSNSTRPITHFLNISDYQKESWPALRSLHWLSSRCQMEFEMSIFSRNVLNGLDPGYCWRFKYWVSGRQLHLPSTVELPLTEVKFVQEIGLSKSHGLKTTLNISMLHGKHSVQAFDLSLRTKKYIGQQKFYFQSGQKILFPFCSTAPWGKLHDQSKMEKQQQQKSNLFPNPKPDLCPSLLEHCIFQKQVISEKYRT